jgi:hypothetical protein
MSSNGPPANRSLRFAVIAVLVAALLLVAGLYITGRIGHGMIAAKSPAAAPAPAATTPPPGGWPGLPAPTPEPPKDPNFHPREVAATTGNVLVNPGFEEGAAGWKWLQWSEHWGPFEMGTAHVVTGRQAAHLKAHGLPRDPATRVFGVVQEIHSPKFPTRISGHYFVERWQPGEARKAYVQVVLIAMQPLGDQPTMQLRYVLDGMEEQPYHMTNARYIVVHPRTHVPTGEWIDFSLDVHGDYMKLWDQVPRDGTGYRVLFEARYDDKTPGETVMLDVWYDDLFVGTP